MPKRVLFLCATDPSRGQMAEALMRQLGGECFVVASACTYPSRRLHPGLVATLARNRVSTDGLVSNDVAILAAQSFDYVIALCDHAHEQCPPLAGADKIHWRFPNPTGIADVPTRNRAFEDLFQGLANRIRLLIIVNEHAGRAES